MVVEWSRARAHGVLASALLEAPVELLTDGDLQKPWH